MQLLSCVRLFATPWTVAYQAPSSMGFSRQECWSGLPFPSPGDLPDPGIEPGSPALQADALLSEPPGKQEISVWILMLFKFSCYKCIILSGYRTQRTFLNYQWCWKKKIRKKIRKEVRNSKRNPYNFNLWSFFPPLNKEASTLIWHCSWRCSCFLDLHFS